MLEVKGNLWDFHERGHWVVVTTNGTIKSNGENVMGRGTALQAKHRFPQVPKLLGQYLSDAGNHCRALWGLGIITFPVKHNWWETADLALIERSCKELVVLVVEIDRHCKDSEPDFEGLPRQIYMIRPGCGNGRLEWLDVKPILELNLGDRFTVVSMD